MASFIPIVLSVGVFLLFAWGVQFHFRSGSMTGPMLLLSTASLATLVLACLKVSIRTPTMVQLVISILLMLAAATIFVWAVSASRASNLALAFADSSSRSVLKGGPYRFIRHPFYLAYILFWVGCACVSGSATVALAASILSVSYYFAAEREEKDMLESALGSHYRDYKMCAGMFFPKLRRCNEHRFARKD